MVIERRFDHEDHLTVELLLGNYHKGDIPRCIRQKGETKGDVFRRRTNLLNLIKRYPKEAYECLEAFKKDHLGSNYKTEESDQPVTVKTLTRFLFVPGRTNNKELVLK